jgi:nitrite reductase (NO-forming)
VLTVPLQRRGAPVDRAHDRVIAASSIALAVGFLVAALLALLLPEAVRHGLWLSIHLALAGAATTAVAGVMPFFVAAFAAAPPADPRLRALAVGATAAGALGIVVGVVGGQSVLSTLGGLLFVVAIALIGLATLRPIGAGLGPARGLVTRSYLLALVAVGTGASLATLLLAGWAPVASSWPHLKPAHAWLNLFGFASLVIATTLLHFFPTVVGTRIPNHRSGRIAVGGLAAGSWLTAAGYAFSIDLVAGLGGVVAMLGGLALGWYLARVWRARGRWTTDHAWHQFAIWGLVSSAFWLLVGLAIAGTRAVRFGADPAGWSMADVVAPLVGGWVTLALLASATHLLPAVGPGDLAAHARQRQVLGRLAVPRLLALDLGVALLTVGQLTGWSVALPVGLGLLGLGVAATAALLGSAVRTGLQWTRRQSPGDRPA